MKKEKNTFRKIISMLLVLALLVSYLPVSEYAAGDETDTRIADTSTMDDWKELFGKNVMSTENAGKVWTDKSVFTNADAFRGTGIKMEDTNQNFLVALSAIASNMAVEGMASVPTDTMIILDLSSSMYKDKNNNFDPTATQKTVSAVNDTMKKLQELNPENRVGITIYFGGPNLLNSTSTPECGRVLLPLGRYTHKNHTYLVTNVTGKVLNSVAVNSGVKNQNGKNVTGSHATPSVAGTYAQLGILHAMEEFLKADTTVSPSASYQSEVTRVPIFIFMSDGEPTAATNQYTNKNAVSVMGNNRIDIRNANETDFVTQLTAAYAREQVDAHYKDTTPLFYTLSLGTSISKEVMDPGHHTTATIDKYWNDLLKNGSVKITVQNCVGEYTVNNREKKTYTVSKVEGFPSGINQKNYVDEAFTAANAEELSEVFDNIYSQIKLKTRYFPTLVEGQEELDGYISFVDKIGQYMTVTDIKGIMIDNTLFSGVNLASNFVAGGGELGTTENPTDLGNELVWSVQRRLGIGDVDTARTLVELAYTHGQLSYKSDTEYSNYIGWYANAAGKFLGFYQEGVTKLPQATGNKETDPAFTVKSYGYLGEVDEDQGVAKTDMMYATVQVRKNIITEEELVTFAVPAALVPIVNYNVTLDKHENLSKLTVTGADSPIRLIYEVALKDAINPFTLKEIVSAEYLAQNTNEDGSVNFYSNQYECDNTTGYGKVNTYSYFNPSRQNEKYYYLEDSVVYADNKGTFYKGNTQPSGVKYRSYLVYKKEGAKLITDIVYRELSEAAMQTAVQKGGTNYWYIPKGNVHVNMNGYTVEKEKNETKTLTYANIPFVDTHNHKVGDLGYHFYIGATLGNNGKLTMIPETGIKITKEMEKGSTAPDTPFTFVLTNTTNTSDNTRYSAYYITADGVNTETTVQFTEGKATVTLHPQDTLYIGGMTQNDVIRIEENETIDSIVQSVNGSAASKEALVTLTANGFAEAHFVNRDRGVGSLTIAKNVVHDFGPEYRIPKDKSFEMLVTLEGVGTANATFAANKTSSDITSITTDANGQFTIQLKHEEQMEIFDLPEGTVATVVEHNPGSGFTASYYENGIEETTDDFAKVTITKNTKVSVLVVNDYTSEKITPVDLEVSGTKYFKYEDGSEVEDWGTYEFIVVIQRNGANGWETVEEIILNNEKRTFTFDLSKEEYTKPGVYSYQVFEKEPADHEKPEGVFYDNVWHTFSVIVSDTDMDGTLEIVRVYSEHTGKDFEKLDNIWKVKNDFTNIQYTTSPAVVTIDMQKRLENKSNSGQVSLSGYALGLYTDEACTIPATIDIDGVKGIDVAATDAVGEGWIDIIFDKTGTYTFYVKEINTGITNMTYSDTVVKVVAHVTNGEGGRLVAEASYDMPTNGEGELEFTNIYDPEDTELAIDFVDKRITGRTLKEGEFTFEVQKPDKTTVLTGTNDTKGNVNFNDTLKFDKVDIYHYNIVETSADGKGVTTDKTVYNIIVTVTDHDGKLSASYVLVNVVGNAIIFQNTYTPKEVTYAIGGNKTLSGRTLLNDEFVFVMTEAADQKGTTITGAKTYETRNYADGSFTFPEITYTKAGSYYYVISEKEAGGSFGIQFDQTEFVVTIEIADNEEGNLMVSKVTYAIKGKGTADEVSFTNYYEPKPTYAQIPGNKNLTGKVLAEGDFRFTLYSSDENWVTGEELETVTNAQDGNFAFSKIDYDTAGTYYYLVKEVNGGRVINGVTYDANEFHVRIEIKDDLKGYLYSEVYIYDNNGNPQENILFVNSYEITGTGSANFGGEKTLIGGEMTDGEFTFELYETDESFTVNKALVKTATNLGGRFDFSIDYTAEDINKTFYYVVREEHGGEIVNGISYSGLEYYITVLVEDNGTGGITTTTTMKKDNMSVSSLDFTNVCVGDLVITKHVEFYKDGQLLTEALDNRADTEYNFTVTFGDGKKECFTLKAGESKVYKDLLYGTAYAVTEETTGMVYTSIITNGAGTIEAVTTDVEVVNTYEYKTYGNTGFDAIKVDTDTLEPLEDAEFTLYADVACETILATATSDTTGKVHFDITEAGTYYLKETKAPEGYYLSDTVYIIKAHTEYVEILEDENAPYIQERLVVRAEGLEGTTEEEDTYTYQIDNKVIALVDVSVEKKWDAPAEITLPGSVEVVLYKNGEVYETVQLSESNDWSYTWSGLTAEDKWTVDEVNIPKDFTRKVESDEYDFVITNTYTEEIKQTGDNPIPTLFGILLLMTGCGVVFTGVTLRKKES